MGFHFESRVKVLPTAADRLIRNRTQLAHVRQLWYFIGSVLAFLALVRFARFLFLRSRYLLNTPKPEFPAKEKRDEEHTAQANSIPLLHRTCSALATGFRVLFFRRSVPIGTSTIASVSELTFILAYFALMLVWLLVDTRRLWPVMYQDRAALLAASQLPLIVALAGKNNIISWLTGVGHEKLNVLHRASARTCLLFAWIHAISRTISGLPAFLALENNWMRSGALALIAFTIATLLSLRPIRNSAFEIFLMSHIVFVFIFLVAGYIHLREQGYGHYLWPASVMWGFDRALRLVRLVWNNRVWDGKQSADALVELLSEDTIRLTMRRRMNWVPGQHAYVILPTVSYLPFEAHPFTIASIPEERNKNKEQDVIFLIRGRNGFTKRLQQHASSNPASRVPAFIDGPYGCPPDLRPYSTCILVAGGSGISYTLPLLLSLIRGNAQGVPSRVRRIIFVWAVRDEVHLTWISKTLTEALALSTPSLIVEPRVYVTRATCPILEMPGFQDRTFSISSKPETKDSDSEIKTELPAYSSLRLMHGRPDMKTLINEEILASLGPISVDVAGPSSLTESIKRCLCSDLSSMRSVLQGTQPVTLHVETFGTVKI